MKANKAYIMAVTTALEKGYVNNPNDRGGPTNHGVTQATLSAYRGYKVSIQEVKDLTKTEAVEILSKGYYDKVWGDHLPDGIDLTMSDWAVNSGPSVPVKHAQKIVGVAADGVMGPKTLKAILMQDPYTLNQKINAARLAFMKDLKDWKYFGRGWTIRVTGKDPKKQWKDAPGIIGMSNDLIRKRPLTVMNAPDVVLDAGKATPAAAKFTYGKTGKLVTLTGVGVAASTVFGYVPTVLGYIFDYGPTVIEHAAQAGTWAERMKPLAIFVPELGYAIQALTVISGIGAMFVNRARERQTGFDDSK